MPWWRAREEWSMQGEAQVSFRKDATGAKLLAVFLLELEKQHAVYCITETLDSWYVEVTGY